MRGGWFSGREDAVASRLVGICESGAETEWEGGRTREVGKATELGGLIVGVEEDVATILGGILDGEELKHFGQSHP